MPPQKVSPVKILPVQPPPPPSPKTCMSQYNDFLLFMWWKCILTFPESSTESTIKDHNTYCMCLVTANRATVCYQHYSLRSEALVTARLMVELFWVMTRRDIVEKIRRFGTSFGSHPQAWWNKLLSSGLRMGSFNEARGWNRKYIPKRRIFLTILGRDVFQ